MKNSIFTLLILLTFNNAMALINYIAIAIIESRCRPNISNGNHLGLFQINIKYVHNYGLITDSISFINNVDLQLTAMDKIVEYNTKYILNNKLGYNYFSLEENLVLSHCAGLTGAKNINKRFKNNNKHISSAIVYLNNYLIIKKVI